MKAKWVALVVVVFGVAAGLGARQWGRASLPGSVAQHQVLAARLCLMCGADPDQGQILGAPLIYHAAEQGHADMARLLLRRGCRVDAEREGHWTPLHAAASRGHTEVVRLLLDSGAKVDARTLSQRTPLHLAARNGHAETATLLLEAGAPINAPDVGGLTPVMVAANHGQPALVKLLRARGGHRSP
ncbi:MAG: hypothetical protein GX774_00025 [Armatimonadetes bacterium]|nr:hypothetical protein [Armatimonadota bacterium]